MDNKKTFRDINIGDTLYEIDNAGGYWEVKVSNISKKGKSTMMLEVDHHLYSQRVNLDASYRRDDSWFSWFIYKEDAVQCIEEQIESANFTYASKVNKLTAQLQKTQGDDYAGQRDFLITSTKLDEQLNELFCQLCLDYKISDEEADGYIEKLKRNLRIQ